MLDCIAVLKFRTKKQKRAEGEKCLCAATAAALRFQPTRTKCGWADRDTQSPACFRVVVACVGLAGVSEPHSLPMSVCQLTAPRFACILLFAVDADDVISVASR